MTSLAPSRRTLRSAAILFVAWLAFYLLQAVISMALPPRSALAPRDWLAIDVTIAALWTGLSAVIARWHARIRSSSPGLFVIVLAHLPLFVVAAVLDAWLARVVIHALNPSTAVVPFWGTVSYYADFDLVSYAAVVAISEALTMRRVAAARERRERRLDAAMRGPDSTFSRHSSVLTSCSTPSARSPSWRTSRRLARNTFFNSSRRASARHSRCGAAKSRSAKS
jgi:hypothetical protein